ncbi:hypothetical protein [Lysobacter gummosus]|uniref:hypothetical protein n=1 Tax=Lysobacter gummosus TaxID=262324 RepID=UPI00362E1171
MPHHPFRYGIDRYHPDLVSLPSNRPPPEPVWGPSGRSAAACGTLGGCERSPVAPLILRLNFFPDRVVPLFGHGRADRSAGAVWPITSCWTRSWSGVSSAATARPSMPWYASTSIGSPR